LLESTLIYTVFFIPAVTTYAGFLGGSCIDHLLGVVTKKNKHEYRVVSGSV